MIQFQPMRRMVSMCVLAAGVFTLAACSSPMWPMNKTSGDSSGAMAAAQRVALSGANEVPPVSTSAAGTGLITVNSDRSVSGSVNVTGMTPTAAHIHEAASGVNGPVIVPLTKSGDTTFTVPTNAKLTETQYASYKAGNLYVNVHSAANPGGEIRAQLKGS